jgi:hypothetical protein
MDIFTHTTYVCRKKSISYTQYHVFQANLVACSSHVNDFILSGWCFKECI